MVEYSEINCKLTNVQLNKLKKAAESNEGAALRLGIKNFDKMNICMNYYQLLNKILNYVMLLVII